MVACLPDGKSSSTTDAPRVSAAALSWIEERRRLDTTETTAAYAGEHVQGLLEAALQEDEEEPETRRPVVGASVQLLFNEELAAIVGRRGILVSDDRSDIPYRVLFPSGHRFWLHGSSVCECGQADELPRLSAAT